MAKSKLLINDKEYFEMPGLNVFVYQNLYQEGHQGGVEIIQHGERVATNGELRLSPSPGQWQPMPQVGDELDRKGGGPQTISIQGRVVDRTSNTISMRCRYPDKSRDRKGFNPIIYPDLQIAYTVKVQAEGQAFDITVDLEQPLPEKWVGRVGYCLELFPGDLYGKTYYMDGQPGIFPYQANGPTYMSTEGEVEAVPLAEGRTLVVAPETEQFRMTITSQAGPLQLLDGSLKHNNGWFVIHALVPASVTKDAIHWKIMPNVIPDWKYGPVIHLSQVGYHPKQKKVAFIEMDKQETALQDATLLKISETGATQVMLTKQPELWGQYLRFRYATFDFTDITAPGVYVVQYGNVSSSPFQIDHNVYKRHVWQPTLEYFLPMQMCHMRVNQKYRVWHGGCHTDDALMAPQNINHFDGYHMLQSPTTPFPFAPLEHVPGFNAGGWHDAGDDDLRTDTQISTVMALAHTYEEFGIDYDETYVDQEYQHVEIHQPDGKPDILQQVEHGVIWLLNFYRQFNNLGFGVIVPTLRQYAHLGDPATQTDNKVMEKSIAQSRAAHTEGLWYKKIANRYSQIFDPSENLHEIEEVIPELDDRLVFPQTNPARQLFGAAGLALAARVLKGYDDALAGECLRVAEALWTANHHLNDHDSRPIYGFYRSGIDSQKIHALVELILTTGKEEYKQELYRLGNVLETQFSNSGWTLGRVLPLLDNPDFLEKATNAAREFQSQLKQKLGESPFGCPLVHVEGFGLVQYFLHKGWPGIFDLGPMFAVMNFILGCRPGKSTNGLVSGVGTNSPVVGYGFNRADWGYIPGGTFCNAINLVRPDFPEDKAWPFMWQEREYLTNSACMFMFTAIAADRASEEENS